MKIAIIGAGASGISLLYNLNKIFASNTIKFNDIQIVIFDTKESVDGGVAYSTVLESHILNMYLSTMTIDPTEPHHFKEWLKVNSESAVRFHDYLDLYQDGNPPRMLIKKYLVDVFEGLISSAKFRTNFSISYCSNEIKNIELIKDELFEISGEDYSGIFNMAVISVGNLPPMNYYPDLIVDSRYYQSPWPFDKVLNGIGVDLYNESTVIGVIGSSLTAIDIALGLIEKGYLGKINFLSRNGLLPTVQSPRPTYHEPKLREKVDSIISDIGKINLDQVIEIIRNEIEWVEGGKINFKGAISRRLNQTAQKNIEQDILKAKNKGFKYQQYFFDISKDLPYIWNKLNFNDKSKFLKDYMSLWSVYRSAMPLRNANRLNDLLLNGKLEVHKLKTSGTNGIIRFQNGFRAETINNSMLDFDYLVNATGSTLNTSNTNHPLIKNIIQSELSEPHPLGGLNVSSHSFEVLDHESKIVSNLYVLGSITRGNFFYTNAYEANVLQAKKLADIIAKRIYNLP